MPHRLVEAPHFGVYHVNLVEAGLLIAKCLWFKGELTSSKLPEATYDFHDDRLEDALKAPANKYTTKLIKAVDIRSLPAKNIRRDIENVILPEKTNVDVFRLWDWLDVRGIDLGQAFEEDYLQGEGDIATAVAECTAAHRQMQKLKMHLSDEALNMGAEALFARHRIAQLETELERLSAPSKHQHPITEKQKAAYLNIIGALLGLLLGKSPSGEPYSRFETQQAIIDGIQGNFGEAPGLSQRNLQDKFAEAKRMLTAST